MKSNQEAARERIRNAYDPALARELFQRAAQAGSSYLESCQDSGATFEIHENTFEALAADALGSAGEMVGPVERFGAQCQLYLSGARRMHSPRYMGHQVPPSLPVAAAFQGVTGLANQGRAVYETSPFAAHIERAVVKALITRIGWSPEHADGIATGGGSLANLTAVLAALHRHAPASWTGGMLQDHRRYCVLTGEDTHYSVARAAGICGIGTDQVINVAVDAERRLRGSALAAAIEGAKQSGLVPFCVVASAPSTPIGAIDALEEIAAVCTREGIWMHCDAVHGASFLFSDRHREKLRGIDAADSVAWDAHKMMHVPSPSTFLLYKNKQESFLPFQQQASYLFAETSEQMWLDGGLRTLECTKPANAAPVWALWSCYGTQIFSDIVDCCMQLTEDFYEMLRDAEDFEAFAAPQTNIICFRYVPAFAKNLDTSALSALQKKIRLALMEKAGFYITGTQLKGAYYLRLTLINPLSERRHLEELLNAIRGLSKSDGLMEAKT